MNVGLLLITVLLFLSLTLLLRRELLLQQPGCASRTDLTLLAEVGDNRLPNGCKKRSARNLGARDASKQQHEEILDQRTHRAITEHE
jgi:hypothetical protein